MVTSGAVPCLTRVCGRVQDARTMAHIAAAFANVTLDTAHHQVIVDEGGVGVLMSITSQAAAIDSPVLQAKESAVQALATLACTDTGRERIIQDGVLVVLTQTCSASNTSVVLLSNVSATSRTARHAPSGAQMIRGGAVEALGELRLSREQAGARKRHDSAHSSRFACRMSCGVDREGRHCVADEARE